MGGFDVFAVDQKIRDSMQAILDSTLVVALAEMGDKTQLLSLMLVLRYKKPWAIMGGIFVATVLNHLMI